MKKVITYGTYDLLHRGHIRLLKRARALGDYLIVGVTADSFDQVRGKINVCQSLTERIENVRATGLADEIIVEEYEGQKIDDVKRLRIDIFTVGSDWRGQFDYLNEYCDVVYLDRTEGVSSTEIRSERAPLRLGFVGGANEMSKHLAEMQYVNGLQASGAFIPFHRGRLTERALVEFGTYQELLAASDAIFVISLPAHRYGHVKEALLAGKHVLCESPIACSEMECRELFDIAREKKLILAEALKTAYATAYHRLLLLVKSGSIGRVISVQSTCTSLFDLQSIKTPLDEKWTSAAAWGPIALLPILQLLGVKFDRRHIVKCSLFEQPDFDVYGKIDLENKDAVGTAVFGKAVKSEGSLVVSGTEGYVFVPAPWWKTDYFEIRREDPAQNRRFFYQLDGEGIRYELASFARSVTTGHERSFIDREITFAIADLVGEFNIGKECSELRPISFEESGPWASVISDPS